MFLEPLPKKKGTLLDFMEKDPIECQELSKDSNEKRTYSKINRKICQFFTDLVKYIQNQKGYIILEEKMLSAPEQ